MWLVNVSRLSVGGRTSSVSVEQRIPRQSNGREPECRYANNVSGSVPRLQGALESGDSDACLQRPQDLHGNELDTF